MIFEWDSGESRKHEFGRLAIGLKQDGKRPSRLVIHQQEIDDAHMPADRLKSYLVKLACALSSNAKPQIIPHAL